MNPPYMSMSRPQLSNVPSSIQFNQQFSISVSIPKDLKAAVIQGKNPRLSQTVLRNFLRHFGFFSVALMDLGFSTHGYHSSSRLVFMEASLSPDCSTLSILSPPNNRVFPPGPGALGLSVSCLV